MIVLTGGIIAREGRYRKRGVGAEELEQSTEGNEVLTALQHRLRELGESTEIVVVK